MDDIVDRLRNVDDPNNPWQLAESIPIREDFAGFYNLYSVLDHVEDIFWNWQQIFVTLQSSPIRGAEDFIKKLKNAMDFVRKNNPNQLESLLDEEIDELSWENRIRTLFPGSGRLLVKLRLGILKEIFVCLVGVAAIFNHVQVITVLFDFIDGLYLIEEDEDEDLQHWVCFSILYVFYDNPNQEWAHNQSLWELLNGIDVSKLPPGDPENEPLATWIRQHIYESQKSRKRPRIDACLRCGGKLLAL